MIRRHRRSRPRPGTAWERRGVNQFRLPHPFLPRFRELLDAELPDVAVSARGRGRAAHEPDGRDARRDHGRLPARTTTASSRSPGAGRWSRRRSPGWPQREPGVEIRRGVAVRGLSATERPTAPSRTSAAWSPTTASTSAPTSSSTPADAGRRCPTGSPPIGARRSRRRGRRLRVRLLRPPLPLGRRRDAADVRAAAAGVRLGVVVHAASPTTATGRSCCSASAKDRALRGLRDVEVVGAGRAQLSADRPLDRRRTGHRHRRDRQDRGSGPPPRPSTAEPVATGVVAIGDAAACTNPSVGRGASIALLHATCLRDVVRKARPQRSGRVRPVVVRGIDRVGRHAVRVATRSTSIATAWPRSTPRSPGFRTRRTTRRGTSVRRCRAGAATDPESAARGDERDVAARPGRRRVRPGRHPRQGARARRRSAARPDPGRTAGPPRRATSTVLHERRSSSSEVASPGCRARCCSPATAITSPCSSGTRRRRPSPPRRGRSGSGAASTSSACRTTSCPGSGRSPSDELPDLLERPRGRGRRCASTDRPRARRDHRWVGAPATTASRRSPGAGRWSRRRSPGSPPTSPGWRSGAASPCAGCSPASRRTVTFRTSSRVVTDDGERIDADLVVDAGGRRSALPGLAGGHRRPPAGRGGRRLRVRLLRAPLPLRRRGDPADVRAAAAAYDSVTWLTAAGRQRQPGR